MSATDTPVEQLSIQIDSDAGSSVEGLTKLTTALERLKQATGGSVGLNPIARQVKNVADATNMLNAQSMKNLNQLALALSRLSAFSNFKLSSSIGNQIRNIGSAISSIQGTDFGGISELVFALKPLNQLNGGAVGLKNTLSQLHRLPKIAADLQTFDWLSFGAHIDQLTKTLTPLAHKLDMVGNAFSKLPVKMRQVAGAAKTVAVSNRHCGLSFLNLWAKARTLLWGLRGIVHIFASVINESNKYVEDLNLFNVAMGDASEGAFDFANKMSNVMGIDPAEWLRNQGIFKTIISSFGVGADKAAYMSENLTRLGYDISSLYDIPFEQSMQKLTSGISGELEPLRRLGYDLSQTRLQMEAESLGIQKKFTEMTQLEKVQLRYNAILKQSTYAQNDMARTLESPANQLRILRAQVTLAARAIGNIFIPILNKILPVAIAVTKVIALLANIIARLFGYKAKVFNTEISAGSSAMGGIADGANDAAGGLGNAAQKAKELKNYLLGIDELNVISPESPSGGSGGGGGGGAGGIGGGGADFDVLGYEWMEVANTKADMIVEKMKEWLGISEDIATWSEFFHTRLGRILTTVGAIGLGLATWKLSRSILHFMEFYATMKGKHLDKFMTMSIGVSLLITGVALEGASILDMVKEGISLENGIQGLIGAGTITVAGTLIGSLLGSNIIGAAIGAAVAGVPLFIASIYTSLKNGITRLSATLTVLSSTLAGAGIGAIIGGPVGAGIGAIIGLVVGLLSDIGILVHQKWDEICEWFDTFIHKTLPQWWNDLPENLGKILGKISAEVWKLLLKILSKLSGFKVKLREKVGEILLGVLERMIDFKFDVIRFIENLPEWIRENLNPKAIYELGRKLGKKLIEGMANIHDAWETFKKSFKKSFREAMGIKEDGSGGEEYQKMGESISEAMFGGLDIGWGDVQEWCYEHVTLPLQEAIENTTAFKIGFEIGTDIKELWKTLKRKWERAKEVLHIDVIIDFIKKPFETVKEWVEKHLNKKDPVKQPVKLERKDWRNLNEWIRSFGGTSSESKVSLRQFNWRTVGQWVASFGGLENWSSVGLNKLWEWWNVSSWVNSQGSTGTTSHVGLTQTSNWTTVSGWVNSQKGSTRIKIAIDLFVDRVTGAVGKIVNAIKGIFATGGAVDSMGRIIRFASGGAMSRAGASFFSHIPQYANGTTGAHGSMFIAGEAGPEIVGHINGRTEILNQSQLAQTMRASTISGMAQFLPVLRTINTTVRNSANAIISSNYADRELICPPELGFDTVALADVTYQETSDLFTNQSNNTDNSSEIYALFEPILKDISGNVRKQADKQEQTIVKVGSKTIKSTLDEEKRASGFSFVD